MSINYFRKLFILLIFLGIISLNFGYTPYSFRYRATAFLFYDDFDLILDPARIPWVKGTRIFTNLSNLITQEEKIVANYSENTFLIGVSTDYLNFIYPALVYDFYSLKEPLMTNLKDREGNPIYGEGKEVVTEWQDIDNNGSYDYKIVREREEKAEREEKRNDFYIGLAKKFGSLSLGIGYFQTGIKSSILTPEYNFNWFQTDYSIINNRFTFGETAKFSGEKKDKNLSHRFLLSSSKELGMFKLGLLLGMEATNFEESNNLSGEWAEVRSQTDFDRGFYLSNSSLPYKGLRIPIDFYLFHSYEREKEVVGYEGRYFLTFSFANSKLDEGFIKEEETSYTSLAPGILFRKDTLIEEKKGKRKENLIKIATHQLFFPAEKFSFGFGCELFYKSFVDSTGSIASQFSFSSFDNQDNQSNRQDSSVEAYSEYGFSNKKTGINFGLTIPVGFEYKPINWFILRMGSRYTWQKQDKTTVEKMTSFKPRKKIITYGDGTRKESVEWTEEKEGTKEDFKEIINSTIFTYGIGITPKDFISIDLTGFGEFLNLANWRISIVFKF